MKVMANLHQKRLGGAEKAHAKRPLKAIVDKYLSAPAKKALVYTALITFAGLATAGTIADAKSKKPKMEQTEKKVYPDKLGPSDKKKNGNKKEKKQVKKKEEISTSELKGYMIKFKKEHGKAYEEISDNDEAFSAFVAVKKPIYLENGKKAVKVVAFVSHKKEEIEQGGDKAAYVMVLLFDTSTGVREGAWIVDLDEVRRDYKKKTGKELGHAHIFVEQDEGKGGEYLQLYVVAASSGKHVEKGIIETGMPIDIIQLAYNPDTGKYGLGDSADYKTASLDKKEDVIAKK